MSNLVSSRAVRVGLVLFVLGLGFIVADVTPFFLDDHNRPLWLNLACLLAPLGFAVAVWAGLAAGREDQRAAVRALDERTSARPGAPAPRDMAH